MRSTMIYKQLQNNQKDIFQTLSRKPDSFFSFSILLSSVPLSVSYSEVMCFFFLMYVPILSRFLGGISVALLIECINLAVLSV